MVGGFCWCLLFLFVPETFWDRTPRPKSRAASRNPSMVSYFRKKMETHASHALSKDAAHQVGENDESIQEKLVSPAGESIKRPPLAHRATSGLHVGFASDEPRLDKIISDNHENDDTHLSPGAKSPASRSATTPVVSSPMSEIQPSCNIRARVTKVGI
jgi:hypothetical protein